MYVHSSHSQCIYTSLALNVHTLISLSIYVHSPHSQCTYTSLSPNILTLASHQELSSRCYQCRLSSLSASDGVPSRCNDDTTAISMAPQGTFSTCEYTPTCCHLLPLAATCCHLLPSCHNDGFCCYSFVSHGFCKRKR